MGTKIQKKATFSDGSFSYLFNLIIWLQLPVHKPLQPVSDKTYISTLRSPRQL
jgi:hypothetical protein